MKQKIRIAMLWLAVAMACPVLTSCDAFWAWYERPVNPQVRVAKNALTIVVGQTAQCNATAQEHIALTYASADPEVATVDQTGLITANKVGTTQITIHAEGDDEYWRTQIFGQRDLTIDVEVVPKKAAAITFANATVERDYGDTPFTITPDNTGDGTISYSSSDTGVASVNTTTGEVTIVGPGSTTITATTADTENYTYAVKTTQYALTVKPAYLVRQYNTSTKQFNQVYKPGTLLTDAPGDVTISGSYVVSGTITIAGKLSLSADAELILLDGSKLTVNGGIDGGTTKSLTLYVQSEGTSAGKINVINPNHNAIKLKNLKIHGGKIEARATSTNNNDQGIHAYADLIIYGGEFNVYGADNYDGGIGAYINGNLIMTGGRFEGTAGNSSNSIAYQGIIIDKNLSLSGDAVIIAIGGNGISGNVRGGVGLLANNIMISDNASITATAGNGSGTESGHWGIFTYNNIDYRGGTIIATGGLNGDNVSRYEAIFGSIVNNSGTTLYYEWSTTAIPTTLTNSKPSGATINYENKPFFKCSK